MAVKPSEGTWPCHWDCSKQGASVLIKMKLRRKGVGRQKNKNEKIEED